MFHLFLKGPDFPKKYLIFRNYFSWLHDFPIFKKLSCWFTNSRLNRASSQLNYNSSGFKSRHFTQYYNLSFTCTVVHTNPPSQAWRITTWIITLKIVIQKSTLAHGCRCTHCLKTILKMSKILKKNLSIGLDILCSLT
jgi:hypothetical protein